MSSHLTAVIRRRVTSNHHLPKCVRVSGSAPTTTRGTSITRSCVPFPNPVRRTFGQNETGNPITATTKNSLGSSSWARIPDEWTNVDPLILPHLRRCDSYPEDPIEQMELADTACHVLFLGTGSGSGNSMSSCTLVRFGAQGFLFDVGEGAQRNLKLSVASKMKKISRIFITHLHADHVLGLPGLLLSSNLAHLFDESTPLQIYGPQGIYNFICTSIALTHSQLRMPIEVYELVGGKVRLHPQRKEMGQSFPQFQHDNVVRKTIRCGEDGLWVIEPSAPVNNRETTDNQQNTNDFQIMAAEVQHVPHVQTFGYVVEEQGPPPKIDPALAIKQLGGLRPGQECRQLQNGFPVFNEEGERRREIHEDEVLTKNPFKGRKLAVLGDTCGVPAPMARLCRNADVLIHEATLVKADEALCIKRGHATASMAGQFADAVNAKLLVLNHSCNNSQNAAQARAIEAMTAIHGGTRVLSACDFMELLIPRGGYNFPTSLECTCEGLLDELRLDRPLTCV